MPAKNMGNPLDRKLNNRQEAFVHALVFDGLSQRQAYIKAGYKCDNWQEHYIDDAASKLLRRPYVLHRFNELCDEKRRTDVENALWTREKAVESNLYLYNIAQKEYEEITKSYEDEIEGLQDQLEEALDNDDLVEAKKIKDKILQKRRARKLGMTQVAAMRGAIDNLNKMHGYEKNDITAMVANIVFTGDDKIKD